jgi:hypothetical protein
MHIQFDHLLLFTAVMIPTWFIFIYFWPRLLLSAYKRAILVKGFVDGPIPVNTLYTEPQKLFAEPITAQSAESSNLMTVGVNHDTLATVAWLDLSKEPLVLHVPAMTGPQSSSVASSGADGSGPDGSGPDASDRYYSVQFTDPSKNTNFAYVGKRTTGTQAGDFLISGPGWKGQAPDGVKLVTSPNNAVLLLGRVLVVNDNDLPAAYALSKQFQLTPLSRWQRPA